MSKNPIKMNIRVPAATHQWMGSGLFPTAHTAAQSIVVASHRLYRLTIEEIKGRFSAGELHMIITSVENLEPAGIAAGGEMLLQINDMVSLRQLDGEIPDIAGFMARIRRLTAYQAAVLQWWAMGYHNLSKRGASSLELQEYLDTICVSEKDLDINTTND
jgi:hypothetical protein